MSLDTSTGEVVAMGEAEARDLIDSIRSTGDIMWRQIVRAFHGRAWIALGYQSWDELCEHEFDGARIKLPREDRREVVASLRDAGMSTRAIGAAIGVSHETAAGDLRGVRNLTPDDPDPTPPHGIERPAVNLDDEIAEAEVVDAGPIEHRPIVGLDGKRYPQPKPAPVSADEQRARDLTESIARHARNLERIISLWPWLSDFAIDPHRTEVIARLTEHDRHLLARIEARIIPLDQEET